jgi:hypothetical protein
MIIKNDAEAMQRVIDRMNSREYWGLVGWLADARPGPLWHYVRPPTKKQRQEWARQREADERWAKAKASERGQFVMAADQAARMALAKT